MLVLLLPEYNLEINPFASDSMINLSHDLSLAHWMAHLAAVASAISGDICILRRSTPASKILPLWSRATHTSPVPTSVMVAASELTFSHSGGGGTHFSKEPVCVGALI